jgi:hypothetical protein
MYVRIDKIYTEKREEKQVGNDGALSKYCYANHGVSLGSKDEADDPPMSKL